MSSDQVTADAPSGCPVHHGYEPFEQDEGWAYVPSIVTTPEQRRRFKHAYIWKILSEQYGSYAGIRFGLRRVDLHNPGVRYRAA